jgi:hypothetical protein
MIQRLVSTKLLACATFLALSIMNCRTDGLTRPCPVYMANHSSLTVWVQVSHTEDLNEDVVENYYMDGGDSLFLFYYPEDYSFWLWGWLDDVRAADTSCFINYPVEIEVPGKTLLVLEDSLGEPVLRVLH